MMNPVIESLNDDTPAPSLLEMLIQEHRTRDEPRLRRLWAYYRNPARSDQSGRAGSLAQAQGLPDRLTALDELGRGSEQPGREIVIENDIAWRINTIVSFMFGKPLAIQSTAKHPGRADLIQRFLRRVFKHNGGGRFFQDLGLLGSVYGYVDVMVRVNESRVPTSTEDASVADRLVLETIEAPRVIPLLSAEDYRRLDAYALHFCRWTPQVEQNHFLSRVRNRVLGGVGRRRRSVVEHTQVWTAASYQQFTAQPGALGGGRKLVSESVNRLGRIRWCISRTCRSRSITRV